MLGVGGLGLVVRSDILRSVCIRSVFVSHLLGLGTGGAGPTSDRGTLPAQSCHRMRLSNPESSQKPAEDK